MANKEIKIELIDRNELIGWIEDQAHIGGKERLLSKTEVIAIIEKCMVWEEKTMVRY